RLAGAGGGVQVHGVRPRGGLQREGAAEIRVVDRRGVVAVAEVEQGGPAHRHLVQRQDVVDGTAQYAQGPADGHPGSRPPGAEVDRVGPGPGQRDVAVDLDGEARPVAVDVGQERAGAVVEGDVPQDVHVPDPVPDVGVAPLVGDGHVAADYGSS